MRGKARHIQYAAPVGWLAGMQAGRMGAEQSVIGLRWKGTNWRYHITEVDLGVRLWLLSFLLDINEVGR